MAEPVVLLEFTELGPLGLMALSLYPVLLDPEAGRVLWERVKR